MNCPNPEEWVSPGLLTTMATRDSTSLEVSEVTGVWRLSSVSRALSTPAQLIKEEQAYAKIIK